MVLLVAERCRCGSTLQTRRKATRNGTWTVPGVAAGEYRVVAIRDGWSLTWKQPEVVSRYLRSAVAISVPPANHAQLASPVLEQQTNNALHGRAQAARPALAYRCCSTTAVALRLRYQERGRLPQVLLHLFTTLFAGFRTLLALFVKYLLCTEQLRSELSRHSSPLRKPVRTMRRYPPLRSP